MAANRDIDLLLIGKTGNGKSATGNSILRKPKSFKAMPTTQSVTTQIHYDFSVFHGRTIKVVDGPGVGDTRMTDEEALKLVQDRLQYAITANPDGFHAFLLVVRYGGRFTREDIQTIESLKKIFGQDFVRNFCVIVITCGDNLESDVEETGMNFNQWVDAQEGVFKDILMECSRRVALFDNKTKDDTKKNDQLNRLVSIVDSLGGQRYTDEHFEKARHLREKMMIEAKEPRVREETLRETAVLMQTLEGVQKQEAEQQTEELKELMKRANKLYQTVQDQDKGTGALKYSLEAARSIVAQIKAQLDHCHKTITDRKKSKEEQERIQREFDSKLKKQNEEYEKRMKEEKEQEERKRKEEREAMEKKWKEQQQKDEERQQERMEALRKELENKSTEERLQREKEFNETMRKEAKEAEKERKREQKELEEKMQKQFQEAENKRRQEEERLREEQKEERERREKEYKRQEEEREKERKAEREKFERELAEERRKAQEAYSHAKEDDENFIVKGIKKAWGFVKSIFK